MRILLAIMLCSAACGTDVDDPGDAGTDPNPDGYTSLIRSPWSLAPSTENYLCVRLTITRDIYIRSIRPVAPIGTHHTVLSVGAPDAPDGAVLCSSASMRNTIFGSGVGTDAMELPPGVAVHVRPGQQLLLNLHLFNASDSTLTGDSGIEVIETDAASVQHEAGVALTGKTNGLTVVPGASVQTGRCTTPAGGTIFAIGPHMHTLGTHMRVTYQATATATPTVLFDRDYSFDEQKYDVLPAAVPTVAGGTLTIECSYFNPTGTTVVFGESTNAEMCFAGVFAYPPPPGRQCTQ